MTRTLAALLAIALCGCETGFRVWESAIYVPSALIAGSMNRFVGKHCPGSIPWDGTAGAPCRSVLVLREPSVETSWTWRPVTPTEPPQLIYARNCASCHDHVDRAPDLRASEFVGRSTYSGLTVFIMMGRPSKGMPGWGGGRLPMEEIEQVAKYIKQ